VAVHPLSYIVNAFPLEIEGLENLRVIEICTKETSSVRRLVQEYIRAHNIDLQVGRDFDIRLAEDRSRALVFYNVDIRDVESVMHEINEKIGRRWIIKRRKYTPQTDAVPLAVALHGRLIDALKAHGWIFIGKYRAFNMDYECEDVPYRVDDKPLVRVFPGIEIRTYAINVIQPLTRRRKIQHVLVIDLRHRIEPNLSMADILNHTNASIEDILRMMDYYVIDYCPLWPTCRKIYDGNCEEGLRAFRRLRKALNKIKIGQKLDLSCEHLAAVINYSNRPLYLLTLERFERRGTKYVLSRIERPADLLSFEPRPEVIDCIARRVLKLKSDVRFTRYMKMKSFHVGDRGIDYEAPRKRFTMIADLINMIRSEIHELEAWGLKVRISENPMEIFVGEMEL